MVLGLAMLFALSKLEALAMTLYVLFWRFALHLLFTPFSGDLGNLQFIRPEFIYSILLDTTTVLTQWRISQWHNGSTKQFV